MAIGVAAIALSVAAMALLPVLAPAQTAVTPPHVVFEPAGTDVCAICHRTHDSPSSAEYRSYLTTETYSSALLLIAPSPNGDTDLCFTCHGSELLGSGVDVLTAFTSESTHSLIPAVSPYGEPEKQCSTCHDSHGMERRLDGTPYPALLRSQSVTPTVGPLVYSGEAFCAACHLSRADERWDGLDVFLQTSHGSVMTTPASGTGVRCSNCHSPHGSSNPPLIVEAVLPPAVGATVTVPANDRRFCYACHSSSLDTYRGKNPYDVSAHGVSAASVAIPGAWPSTEATRLVGECQVCHAPMGRDDGSGVAIPELAERPGRALCDECHDSDGPADADVASIPPSPLAGPDLELLVSVVPSTPTSYDERLAVYSRETTGAQPRMMVGPREYRPDIGMGELAAGDLDGDGENEIVLADPSQAALDVWAYDPLRGIADQTGTGADLPIAAPADLIVVADVILDGSGRPEVAVVDASAGLLRLYRLQGGSLVLVDGPLSVGTAPSSLASGDVTGTVAADLVVTAYGDDAFYVLTESGGVLASSGALAAGSGPRGASVGDAWSGGAKLEIAMVSSNAATASVSVFDGAGDLKGTSGDVVPAGVRPFDSIIADVLPGITPAGTSGLEVSVVYRDDGTGSDSIVRTFAQLTGGGLAAPQEYTIGANFRSAELASGDVDGDGRVELVVGSGGNWTRDASRLSPSASVLRANAAGTLIATAETLWAGGADLAGSSTALAIADLGLVGRTRHPVGAVDGAHLSTEGSLAARHVECPDCHNAHEATSTVAAAPDSYGAILGTWGVSVTNVSDVLVTFAEEQGVTTEYGLCFKCHSGWAALGSSRDLSYDFNPLNLSEHAVEEASTDSEATPGSFVGGWGNDSVLFCIDCHSMSEPLEASGPHASDEAPILVSPYLGTRPESAELLCYDCHDYDVYYSGVADGVPASTSGFYDPSLAAGRQKLHAFHDGTMGHGCAACHVGHGTRNESHLIRDEVGYTHSVSGGDCANDCHTGGVSHAYARP